MNGTMTLQPKPMPRKRQRQTTIAEDFGFVLREEWLPVHLRPVAQRLYLQVRALAPSDAIIWGDYALEYIVPEHPDDLELPDDAPGPGYPFFILYHHVMNTTADWHCIVQVRANDLNPREIRRQLPGLRRTLALCLAQLHIKPEAGRHVPFGAITDPTQKLYRVKHLF